MDFEMTVYILRCADGSYYVGSTKQSVEARVWEHTTYASTATQRVEGR